MLRSVDNPQSKSGLLMTLSKLRDVRIFQLGEAGPANTCFLQRSAGDEPVYFAASS